MQLSGGLDLELVYRTGSSRAHTGSAYSWLPKELCLCGDSVFSCALRNPQGSFLFPPPSSIYIFFMSEHPRGPSTSHV